MLNQYLGIHSLLGQNERIRYCLKVNQYHQQMFSEVIQFLHHLQTQHLSQENTLGQLCFRQQQIHSQVTVKSHQRLPFSRTSVLMLLSHLFLALVKRMSQSVKILQIIIHSQLNFRVTPVLVTQQVQNITFVSVLTFGYQKMIKHFSIYQSDRYPFQCTLVGSCNSRYSKLLVDFEAEVKMTWKRAC